jgi:hypothetical protein
MDYHKTGLFHFGTEFNHPWHDFLNSVVTNHRGTWPLGDAIVSFVKIEQNMYLICFFFFFFF